VPTLFIELAALAPNYRAQLDLKNASPRKYWRVLGAALQKIWAAQGFPSVTFIPDTLTIRARDISVAMLTLLIEQGIITTISGKQAWREQRYYLMQGAECLLASQCCSDWNDVQDWQVAAQYRANQWQMLWIGHPWVMIRYVDGQLHISDYTEEAETIVHAAGRVEKRVPHYTPRYAVDAVVLAQCADQMQQEITAFEARLAQAWAASQPE
jgi:hypothetical protein